MILGPSCLGSVGGCFEQNLMNASRNISLKNESDATATALADAMNVDTVFQEYDQNDDGIITRTEFKNRRLFRQVDTNQDSQITSEEAQIYLQSRQESQPFSSPSNTSSSSTTDSSSTSLNIPYVTISGVDPSLTSLDIYASESLQDAPVLIYVHGGGWRRGDKANVNIKPSFFNSEGYVFVSINYRLVPEASFPENVQDVAGAVAWVHANIQQYGGNPNEIFILGHSAGAHLAGLVATDGQYLEAAGESVSTLKGVVLLDGVGYDIPLALQSSGVQLESLYRNAFGTDPDVWKEASPINHVASNQGIPPFLLIYADDNRPREIQATRFAQVLRSAGIRADIGSAPEETHQSVNQTLGEPENEATDLVANFLESLQ